MPKRTWVFGIENRQNKLQAHDALTRGSDESMRDAPVTKGLFMLKPIPTGGEKKKKGFLVFTVYLYLDTYLIGKLKWR